MPSRLILDGAAGLLWIFCALFAEAVDLECVTGGGVVVLASDLLLDLFDLGREEFDGAAAVCADHVVMGAAIVLMFVARDSIMERQLGCESAFGEEFERAIDRGESDLRIFLLHETVEFICREMITDLEERLEDGVALLGVFEAYALEMRMEDLLRFSKHFLRNRRLIVDPF
jgi:hypothetical protein